MFTTKRSRALIGAVTLSVLSLTACGSDSSDGAKGGKAITLAAVPSESSASLSADYDKIAKLIEKETGNTVTFQNVSDYAAVIEGMRAGQIDIASFGPFSYVIAKDSGVNLKPAASGTDNENEPPAYTSLAYVRADENGISSLADLKGKKVCFVDQASTSGYLVPMKGLMDEGIDLNADLTPILAGGHDASLLSLDSGNCDVAFAHDTMLSTLTTSGQVKDGALKPIWESDPITEDPIAVNYGTLDEETANKIVEAIRTKANKPALVEEGICDSVDNCELPEELEWGYLPVEDSDFDSIRDICKATNAPACRNVG
ncbi:phosphate/phosphite/phosphonate ABC transporter substrate-binding protein [Corynebacterium liangguodongii]|uniref:Phosphate starvation-inducible protein PhoH n=1 Tax=Corynebacterium liangguodongii TaxID=2079535 RepID=A0A2S0WFF2_9CORY|nr:phosphate/phosphite/phosphonate ABC transporter substrate-binding protein [Corynebacterium liangguodongii]AWB84486.1 phosphate starvation-inducible protein PhoH [Corynebacterium liangguodongii]PWB98704.1 phosphate/phosphite/phosphonate ABC transporter substrate-binding protein [Corynebacterium liangguodongii]